MPGAEAGPVHAQHSAQAPWPLPPRGEHVWGLTSWAGETQLLTESYTEEGLNTLRFGLVSFCRPYRPLVLTVCYLMEQKTSPCRKE